MYFTYMQISDEEIWEFQNDLSMFSYCQDHGYEVFSSDLISAIYFSLTFKKERDESPLAKALYGAHKIEDKSAEKYYFGNIYYLDSSEVHLATQMLQTMSLDQFASKLDIQNFIINDVRAGLWSKWNEKSLARLLEDYKNLIEFYQHSEHNQKAIVILEI